MNVRTITSNELLVLWSREEVDDILREHAFARCAVSHEIMSKASVDIDEDQASLRVKMSESEAKSVFKDAAFHKTREVLMEFVTSGQPQVTKNDVDLLAKKVIQALLETKL